MRSWTRVLVLAIGPALLAAAPAAPAFAQGAAEPQAADVEKATAHFKKGVGFFNGQKYALALEEFRSSYAAVKSPNSRLYVARALAELGEHVEAYAEFEGVAAEAAERAATEPKYAQTGETARTERDEVAHKIGLVKVQIVTSGPSDRLVVAGKDVPRDRWDKPIAVAPGSVEVTLQTDKGPVSETLTLAAGEKRDVTLDASPAVALVPGDGDGDGGGKVVTSSGPAPTWMRPASYGALGVGVAGLAVFTVAGIMANSTYSDLSDSCGGPCPSARADDISAGQTQQTIANVGLLIGAVGVATGITLFALSRGSSSEGSVPASAKVRVSPGYIGVNGTF